MRARSLLAALLLATSPVGALTMVPETGLTNADSREALNGNERSTLAPGRLSGPVLSELATPSPRLHSVPLQAPLPAGVALFGTAICVLALLRGAPFKGRQRDLR